MSETKILEKSIGYSFKDKDLLQKALTHSSYASEHKLPYEFNNERLEFIGDAYLDAVVGMRLFEILDDAHEGMLSKRRADVVCETSLADVAKDINLGYYLYLGNGEDQNGGREKASILADALEALIGAVLIDGGYDSCEMTVLKLLSDKIDLAAKGKLSRDFKTRLQETVQNTYKEADISYNTVSESGPDHKKIFTIELTLNGDIIGRGTGTSKARAEQSAAEDALSKGAI